MKPTTGYETNRTENNIIRGHTYVTELTKTIPNLGLTEIPDEFFLGWINPYLLSDCLKSTGMAITGTGDDEGIEFVPPTYTTNIPMGYMYRPITSGVGNTTLWIENGGTLQIEAYGNPRFIKKFYPECYSLVPNSIMLGFDFNIYTPPPSSQLQNSNAGYSFTLNFGEFKQFVRGQFSKEITFTWNGFQMKVTLTGSDFLDGTVYKADENGSGYEFRIFLRKYSFNSFYGGEYAQTSGYAIIPMIQQNVSYSFTDSSEDFTVDEMRAWTGWTGTASLAQLRMNTSTHTIRDMTRGDAISRGAGACHSSIKFKVDMLDDETLLFGNGIVGHKTSGYVWNFYVYYKIAEIEKMLNLFARVSKYTIVSYMPDDSFATRVDSNDEFLAELHSGNIQDQPFRESLRDWQYVPLDDDGTDDGTAKNEFDPETDLPPYDPTPPTPPTPGGEEGHNPDNPELSLGDTEDVPGDSVEEDEHRDSPIQFPVSAFMTQYVLTASDVYNMGRTLWSAVGDPNSNVAANFWKTYTSTGTVNIANLMDFFVSVKCFPFDMTNIAYGRQAPAMTVGTGAVPILNSSVWVLGVSTYIVDCGTVTTNIKPFSFGVNSNAYDFRNYVNCEITCFLPYCGTVELNPADVFPYTLSCKYFIDMLSGSCTAVLWAERPDGEVPVASKTGQIGKIVPISATNVMSVAGQALSGVASVAQTVGDAVISAVTRKALGSSQIPVNEASKNKEYLQEVANYKQGQQDIRDQSANASGILGAATGAVGGIGNIMSRKGISAPALSAGTGLEAMHISERPYIVIRRLNYSSPNNYAHTTGFATTDGGGENNKATIGAYSGWTVFQNPDLSGIVATKEELDEIKMLLETGVYL